MKAWFFCFFNYIFEINLFAFNFYHFILAGRKPLGVLSTQDNSFVILTGKTEAFPNVSLRHFLLGFPYAPLKQNLSFHENEWLW